MWIVELTKTFERKNPAEPDMNVNNTSAITQQLTGFTSINYGEKFSLNKYITEVDFHPPIESPTFTACVQYSIIFFKTFLSLRLPKI